MKHHCDESRHLNSCGEYEHHVDNSCSTIQKLTTLYSEPELSDLKLFVGDHVFLTHKLILSISSDVFKTMLTSPTWPEAYKDQVHLQEETECQEVFSDFLQYLYTGKIRMSHVTVLPILSLADKYNIGDLSQLCINYMCCHYVAPKEQSQVISWYKYATMCGHKLLERVCEEYILWNFQYVTDTEDFLSASAEVLVHFLKSSDVTVHSEHCLYQIVKRWVTKKAAGIDTEGTKSVTVSSQDTELEYVIKQISHHISFSLMTCSELNMLQEDSLVKDHSELFQTPINSAIQLRRAHLSIENQSYPSQIPIPEFHQNHINSCLSHNSTESKEKHSHEAESSVLSNQKSVDLNKNLTSDNGVSEKFSEKFEVSELGGSTTNTNYSYIQSSSEHKNGRHIKKFKRGSPRIYTCDSWCTEVMVEGLEEVPRGEVLGAFFSTPVNGLEEDDSNYWDWHLDLYPNSVNFKKCMMIGIFENSEIDEVAYETIRITVTSNIREKRKVRVNVLVFGHQNGIEYVAKVISKTCFFDEDNILHNLNDIIPYHDIHCEESQFKIGIKNDTLKVKIVIRPITHVPVDTCKP